MTKQERINNKPITTEAAIRELYEDFEEGAEFQEGDSIKTGFFNPWRRDKLLKEMEKETFITEYKRSIQIMTWLSGLNQSFCNDFLKIVVLIPFIFHKVGGLERPRKTVAV